MIISIFKAIFCVFLVFVIIGGIIELIHSLIKFSLGFDQKSDDSGTSRRS